MLPHIGPAVPRRGTSISRMLVLRLFFACGWRIEGTIPNVPKAVVVGAPHTSNWDLAITLAGAFGLGVRVFWVGKHTLFRGIAGAVLRWLGGISVNRRQARGFVESVLREYKWRDQFFVAIMPEGTRYAVREWKTGFYHIAYGAQVPIILAAFDYGHQVLRFGPAIMPSGDLDHDLALIKAHFAGIRGKHPRPPAPPDP